MSKSLCFESEYLSSPINFHILEHREFSVTSKKLFERRAFLNYCSKQSDYITSIPHRKHKNIEEGLYIGENNLVNNDEKFLKVYNFPLDIFEKILVDIILPQRQRAIELIKKLIKLKLFRRSVKTFYFIKQIIQIRHDVSTIIQKVFRKYICLKSIKKLIQMNKENYTLYYYPASDIYSVQILFYQEKNNQYFIFTYNRFLDCFFLFIKKQEYYKRQYKFNFIINDIIVIDTNFEKIWDTKGKYYNILDFSEMRRKGYLSNVKEKDDEFEIRMPRRKMTYPFDNNDFEDEYYGISHSQFTLPKSLLNSLSDIQNKTSRKVSLNLKANYMD